VPTAWRQRDNRSRKALRVPFPAHTVPPHRLVRRVVEPAHESGGR
jgi:hypothetical protein